MTRDEHREKCIEAMHDAFYARTSGLPVSIHEALEAAFDALPSACADVVPVEVTEEMLMRGHLQSTLPGVWRVMRAAGSLTNPPGPKTAGTKDHRICKDRTHQT
jgi:hypothetical protein